MSKDAHTPPQATAPRRRFLKAAALALQGVIGLAVAAPVLGVFAWPLFRRRTTQRPDWRLLGPVSDFLRDIPTKITLLGTFEDAWVRRSDVSVGAAWVINRGDERYDVFTTVCPHLGCSVGWRGDEAKFVCPCHGSQFDARGQRIETATADNPAPRGMDPLEWRVEGGRLYARYERFRTGIPKREPIA